MVDELTRRRLTLTAMALIIAVVFGHLCGHVHAGEKDALIFRIKNNVIPGDTIVRLKDLVVNKQQIDDTLLELEITRAPVKKDRTISIIDLAYMMQQYPELMSASLRGPRQITIKRIRSTEFLTLAKNSILNYIQSNPPWEDWEVDVLLNANDELLISRVGTFKRVKVFPFDNKTMIGTVAFRLTFFDGLDREVGKATISPVILRKVKVSVVNGRCRQGSVLKLTDIKKVPLWIGGEKMGYVIDEKECIGRELSRSLSPGDIIRSSDLLNPICAKRGEVIWVECLAGALRVRLAATALETGRKGDMIRVLNQSSQRVLKVELIENKKATYALGS